MNTPILKTKNVSSILNKKKKRDSWFLDDYTLNMYSGCSFNCLYCYIRGSKYGSNMEEKLTFKENSLRLLDKQLAFRFRKKQFGFIIFSSSTDPYLQFEKELQYTRKALEIILKHRFPVHMLTKSNLIEKDLDLLKAINEKAILPKDLENKLNGTLISFSFSNLSDTAGKIFEPGAPLPSARLATLKKTAKQGLKTGVSLMPLLPYISDTTEHLNLLFDSFKKAGAHYVMPSGLSLFGQERADSRSMVFRAIEKYYPDLLPRYRKWFEQSDYPPDFYQKAFMHKMKELSLTFNLPTKIISS